jgi:histidinol-phosphate aminotransferase
MVFGDPELIQALSRVKYPYNVNSLTISTALDSLSDSRQYEAWVRLIVEERDRLSRELNALPLIRKVYPSDANFLLVQVDDPRGIYQSLMDRGIIVRDRSSVPLCEGCLRITVGTPDENRLLLEALSVINATNEKNQA